MATYSGERITGGLALTPNAPACNVSAFAATIDAYRVARTSALPDQGSYTNTRPKADALTRPEPQAHIAGEAAPGHGQELFEKLIVTPRAYNFGTVLDDSQAWVSIWNTSLTQALTLTAITITGSGNVFYTNPFGLPLIFGPQRAISYQISAPRDGDPSILARLRFLFQGRDPDLFGAYSDLSGLRLVVFGFDPDWTATVREASEYLTEIIAAWDDSEQRIRKRNLPRTLLTYAVLTTDPVERARLDAVLWSLQGNRLAVPFWPDAQPLQADALVGASVLQLDTSYRHFAVASPVLLWRDPLHLEAQLITAMTAGSVTLASPLATRFPADGLSFVIPLLLGGLPDEQAFTVAAGASSSGEVKFICEVV